MLLTKECDYGVRIVRGLADGRKKTVNALCKKEQIPVPYAYKILKKLEQAGLLHSLRGRDGGYQLARSLDEMTLYNIFAAVDEQLFIFECLDDKKICPFHRPQEPCSVHLELERLQDVLIGEMRAKTMRQVLSPSAVT